AEQQAYVHVKVYLLSGRDQQQKQGIGKNVLKVLLSYSALQQQDFPVQSCVDLIEMPKKEYFKNLIKSKF
ncbi:5-carboxymethyl-2-hydroxymuconate isomerase, partial [Acinetobacter ursingii]